MFSPRRGFTSLLLSALVLACACQPALAQSGSKTRVGLFVQASGSNPSPGFGLAAGHRLNTALSWLALDANVHLGYSRTTDTFSYAASKQTRTLQVRKMEAGIGLSAKASARAVRPYVGVGLGYAHYAASDDVAVAMTGSPHIREGSMTAIGSVGVAYTGLSIVEPYVAYRAVAYLDAFERSVLGVGEPLPGRSMGYIVVGMAFGL